MIFTGICFTSLQEADLVVVKTIGIVPEFIHRENRVLLPPDNDFHIAADIVGRVEQAPPIKGRRAVYLVNEQKGTQSAIRVVGCLAYLVRRLQVYFFDGVCFIRGILVQV